MEKHVCATLICSVLALSAAFGKEPTRPAAAPVNVSSQPAGAELSIDGEKLGPTPVTVMLVPGTHVARLAPPGQSATFFSFDTNGGTADVSFPLPAPSVTVLAVSDPEGATVTRDGSVVGVTPVLLPDVPAGRHEFTFALNGYREHRTEIDLAAPAPVRISARLVPSSATLHVTTVPAGADVTVNGVPRGASPVDVTGVPEGESSLEISMPGYKTYRSRMRLAAGDEQTVHAPLEPIPSTLTVTTVPAGAKIYIDDEFRGVSPLTLKDIPAATYRVRTDLAGFDPAARTVELPLDSSKTEEFRLVPNVGVIRLSTSPAGVTVFVDGAKAGVTAAKTGADDISETFEISGIGAGARVLEFERPGYAKSSQTVTVVRDQTVNVETVRLERRFIPDIDVTTAAGTVRGVFIEKTDEFYRVETAPGLIRSFPMEDIVRVSLLKNP